MATATFTSDADIAKVMFPGMQALVYNELKKQLEVEFGKILDTALKQIYKQTLAATQSMDICEGRALNIVFTIDGVNKVYDKLNSSLDNQL